jgi:hypothetical protein
MNELRWRERLSLRPWPLFVYLFRSSRVSARQQAIMFFCDHRGLRTRKKANFRKASKVDGESLNPLRAARKFPEFRVEENS